MNAATILKFKGSGVVTTTANRSLLDIAKLLWGVPTGDPVAAEGAQAGHLAFCWGHEKPLGGVCTASSVGLLAPSRRAATLRDVARPKAD
jgi:hypothetical protein